MQWENALDALAVGDPAHGECFIESAAFATNHYASEYLDSFLVPFHNASVNAHAVADGKLRRVASLLFFLDGIDNLIHDNIPFPPAGRANIFIRTTSNCKLKSLNYSPRNRDEERSVIENRLNSSLQFSSPAPPLSSTPAAETVRVSQSNSLESVVWQLQPRLAARSF